MLAFCFIYCFILVDDKWVSGMQITFSKQWHWWKIRRFSHDGKVRILNFNSKCAFCITQCTHERSNCDIWITQCTHERPNLGFCIPAGEECLGTLPIKHAWSSHFLCFCTYMQRAVYRRKSLEGHLAPPHKSRFRGQGIHTVISLRDLRDA